MKVVLYILILFSVGSITAQKSLAQLLKQYNTKSVSYISVTELRMFQSQKKVLILDSREKNEYDVSHIPSAVHLGFKDFSTKNISEIIPNKEALIVVYCTLGIRSETIINKLQKAGYNNIKNLYGGICEWKNKNFVIIDSTNTETENVHTFSKHWGKWLKNGEKVYD